MFAVLLLSHCVAHAQNSISLENADLLNSSKPSPFDISQFQSGNSEVEILYPLAASILDAPPKRKPGQATKPAVPPDLRYDVVQSGKASGTIGGDQHSEGNVVAKITDLNSGHVATLYAQVVDYNAKTGMVTASGGANPPTQIRLVAEEGIITGDSLKYNLVENYGELTNATVTAETFRLHGTTIDARDDGSYVAHNAMFTSCVHGSLDGTKGYPDYRVQAKLITVYPNQYLLASRVTFYIGRQKTLPLPYLKRDLTSAAPVSTVPTPSYNRTNGFTLHFQGEPESEHHATFDYNVFASVSTLPTGYLLYQSDVSHNSPASIPPKGILTSLGDPLNSLLQQFNPPTYRAYAEGRPYETYPDRVTFYSILGNQQYIYNRTETDLSLSRFPEVGVHIGNILGKLAPESPAPISFERDRIPYAPALLEAYFSMGVLHESPTGVTAGRAFSRINFASQPQLLGHRLSWRYAATNWLNAYTSGTVYELFAPEVELDYVPTSTSSLNLGYRYLTDAGETPFVTDHRDIRHETRIQYQVGGPIRFAVTLKYDIGELRPYDEEFAIVRNLDCMQYGIAYRVLSRQFNVIFSLLPNKKKQAQ